MGNTILIAEDFKPALQMLVKLFSGAGFTVYPVRTCAEAVKLAAQHLPDCFLLDYYLEDGPVPVVCSFIRGHEALKDVPIVMYSSHDEEAENCYAACQADVFIQKGRPGSVVLAAVNHHLRRMARKCDAAVQSDLTPDPTTLQVLRHGAPLVSLSLEQFRLFSVLFARRPCFVPDSELAAHVFPGISQERLEALFSLVYRLRRRLGVRYGRRIVCKNGRGWAYIQPRLRAQKPLVTENSPV